MKNLVGHAQEFEIYFEHKGEPLDITLKRKLWGYRYSGGKPELSHDFLNQQKGTGAKLNTITLGCLCKVKASTRGRSSLKHLVLSLRSSLPVNTISLPKSQFSLSHYGNRYTVRKVTSTNYANQIYPSFKHKWAHVPDRIKAWELWIN